MFYRFSGYAVRPLLFEKQDHLLAGIFVAGSAAEVDEELRSQSSHVLREVLPPLGALVGVVVGSTGAPVGATYCVLVGLSVGVSVGCGVGCIVGSSVGVIDGMSVGTSVTGASVGARSGHSVGVSVGVSVPIGVGVSVRAPCTRNLVQGRLEHLGRRAGGQICPGAPVQLTRPTNQIVGLGHHPRTAARPDGTGAPPRPPSKICDPVRRGPVFFGAGCWRMAPVRILPPALAEDAEDVEAPPQPSATGPRRRRACG